MQTVPQKTNYWKEVFNEEHPPPLTSCDYQKKAKEAYNRAHDLRKFEIELYWKRAIYFWGFETSLFLLLGVSLSGSEFTQPDLFLSAIISTIGLLLTQHWLKSIEGSKSWLKNWELHIDILEEYFSGHLYKSVLSDNCEPFFSVTSINQKVISLIKLIWIISICYSSFSLFFTTKFISSYKSFFIKNLNEIKLIVLILLFIFFCIYYLIQSYKISSSFYYKSSENRCRDCYITTRKKILSNRISYLFIDQLKK